MGVKIQLTFIVKRRDDMLFSGLVAGEGVDWDISYIRGS